MTFKKDPPAEETTVVALPDVQGSALRVASARLEASLDHEDFAELLEELIRNVREDEKLKAKLSAVIAVDPPAAAPLPGALRIMQKDDADEILKRARAAARTPSGKYFQGFAEQLAAEFKYSKGQIGTLIRTVAAAA